MTTSLTTTPGAQQRFIPPDETLLPALPLERPAPAGAWQLLALAGWAFLIVGGLDVSLVWYPAALGDAAWEFGSITASLNGFPLPIIGTCLILASAVARGKSRLALAPFVAAGLFLLAAVGMGLLYALDVTIALKSVNEPLARAGLQKAILRSLVQLVVYPLTLLIVMVRARKLLKTGDPV